MDIIYLKTDLKKYLISTCKNYLDDILDIKNKISILVL
jgi:hypothetical protein